MNNHRTLRCIHGFAPRLCIDSACPHYDGVRRVRDLTRSHGKRSRSGIIQCLRCRRRVPRELLTGTRRCDCEGDLRLTQDEKARMGGVR